ncbi:hypothetical protein [Pedosphaera parvula]|uniref:Uncharacterized protein n=1 Tax=Pedosphaera parvula (strain Ellin514) TaxID=320771 RepID=B9XHU0_PEDPL|nr:hypothetical protein [Pedosphaera parvula]EEF60668.1 hypothetical protein Cflav_PD6259 [Pedosphaera parvula Ellin514]
MEGDDQNSDPVSEILSSIEEAALDSDPSSDSDSPRDVWWLRWLKYVSIIAMPAIILGLGFLFEDYIGQYHADTHYQRDMAQRHVEHDTIGSMKFRFWMGVGVGGSLGMIYVVRCIVRRVDP